MHNQPRLQIDCSVGRFTLMLMSMVCLLCSEIKERITIRSAVAWCKIAWISLVADL